MPPIRKGVQIFDLKHGVIVCTHKGGGERSSQIRAIAYKREGGFQGSVRTQKIFFLNHKISKFFFFCTKEAITLPFIIVYNNV